MFWTVTSTFLNFSVKATSGAFITFCDKALVYLLKLQCQKIFQNCFFNGRNVFILPRTLKFGLRHNYNIHYQILFNLLYLLYFIIILLKILPRDKYSRFQYINSDWMKFLVTSLRLFHTLEVVYIRPVFPHILMLSQISLIICKCYNEWTFSSKTVNHDHL